MNSGSCDKVRNYMGIEIIFSLVDAGYYHNACAIAFAGGLRCCGWDCCEQPCPLGIAWCGLCEIVLWCNDNRRWDLS